MKRYFEISCHCLIGAAFFALALTGRLDTIALVVFTLAFLRSLYRSILGRPPLLTSRGAFYLSCAYIVVFVADLNVFSRSLIGATVHLVLFLELAKLYQEKSDRDYLYLILLSFLKILAASSLTVDISFAATLFLFLVALVSTLMSFDMYRSERKASNPGRSPAGALAGMSVWSTLWIVILGTGMFFTIPRVGTGYFTRAVTSPLLLSGFTDNVSLGQIGRLKLSSAIVMHAKRLTGTPFAVLKWRGIVLDTFNGKNWFKKNRGRAVIAPEDATFTLRRGAVTGELVHYEILLEPLATTVLFGPHQLRQVSSRMIPGLELDEDGAVFVRFQQSQRLQYEVHSEIAQRITSSGNTGDARPLPPGLQSTYLQLPSDIDPQIVELARTITESAETPLDKAVRVEAYLKRNYKYTLSLTWDPGSQPLRTFLISAKSGHCEYFASAMAILLRAAGVPTRLVNGFLMGEYNPVGDAYIVRQSDAHSWVEVYIPGSGWTEFDPTPPSGSETDSGLIAQIGNYADAVGLFWNTYVLTYDTDSQMQLFHSAQESVQAIQTRMEVRTERWVVASQRFADWLSASLHGGANRLRTALILVSAIALILAVRYRSALWTRWRLLRLKSNPDSGDFRLVAILFQRAVRLAGRAVPERRPAQTWREWIEAVPNDQRRSLLLRAGDIFEKSKYSGHAPSAADLDSLQQTVQQLRSLPR